MLQQKLPKLITIVGPTASGKTSWGIEIAKEIGGEIISADSRQVYRHMDIGTAKEPGTWKYTFSIPPYRSYMVDTVSHHLIDYVDPKKRYTVAHFQRDAIRKIDSIQKRNHVPMIVGGTGLYVQSVVDNFLIPTVPPNVTLRSTLEAYSTEALVTKLRELDTSTAQTIDVHNRRRIIRAIEVATYSTEVIPKYTEPRYDTLQIGIHVEREVLYTRINTRVDAMIDAGLIHEIQSLLDCGYDWDLPSMSSVGYRQFRPYFEGNASLKACIELLKRDTRRYAKRQLTWFRRDSRIVWCTSIEEAKKHIQTFLL
jgi:tRNA dimethylallyltransferase